MPRGILKGKKKLTEEELKAKRKTPEYKAKRNTKESTPEYKAKRKEERKRPETLAKEKTRQQQPDYKEKTRIRQQEKRMKVYSVYSKRHSNSDIPCCRCCEETMMEFLAVDHIDGRKNLPEKEKNLRSINLVNFLIKNNFPEGYQILCHNCNMAKGFYGKYPHEKK